ncbi:hypothetical protein I4U23_004385 [Adineta vaga]|nr:hypothetical protein I4U23_004385 [Adineta vaga]
MIIVLTALIACIILSTEGQTTEPPNYVCNEHDNSVEFTTSSSNHSAWDLTSNCFLQEYQKCSHTNNSCRSLSTPCFDYLTVNNTIYRTPAILCSILVPCDNITYTCASTTSVCVVNSCCSPRTVCLPLFLTNFCTPCQLTYSFYEGQTVNLACANSMTLNILNAFFGVLSCVNCACGYCHCGNMNVTSTIGSRCAGLASCSFTADRFTLGDPCYGYHKVFQVTFVCS